MNEKFENAKNRVRSSAVKVKEHVVEHKTKYIIAGGVVICAATGVVLYRLNKNLVENNRLMTRLENSVTATVKDTTINGDVNSPLIDIDYNVTVENFAPRANPVKRLSDGKVWANQAAAAIANNGHPGRMSQHLNGKLADFHGEQYMNIGYDEFVSASQ